MEEAAFWQLFSFCERSPAFQKNEYLFVFLFIFLNLMVK